VSEAAPALLSIGINSGGVSPENKPIHDALSELQRRVIHERTRFPNEGVRINVVFDIPGPLFQPDHEGVRVARFDRRQKHILIIAAVPPQLKAHDFEEYAANALRNALAATEAHIAKHQSPDTDAAARLIRHLAG
jgi:hypothetical protein